MTYTFIKVRRFLFFFLIRMIGSFFHQASHVHIKIENKEGPPVWNYVRGQGEN